MLELKNEITQLRITKESFSMEKRVLNLETKSQENNNELCEGKKGKMKNRRYGILKYSKNHESKKL